MFAKMNPNYKRAQPLPVISDFLPPTVVAAARRISEFTPSQTGPCPQMIELAVCAGSVSQSIIPPAVRLVN